VDNLKEGFSDPVLEPHNPPPKIPQYKVYYIAKGGKSQSKSSLKVLFLSLLNYHQRGLNPVV